MLDLKIRNARIIDGTGKPWFRGDVGIEGGRIARVGDLTGAGARSTFDADDCYLAPGFIDIHTHSDFSLPTFPRAESLISQGITTEVVGNCGLTPHPVNPENLELLQRYTAFLGADLSWDWRSTTQFLDYLDELPLSHDVITLVGHGSVRVAVMGFDKRAPTSQERDQMRRLIADAMEAGAVGMSSGLIYAPGSYADTSEISDLCDVVQKFGGIYTSHLRNESENLLEAVEEAIEIGERTRIPVHFSHHKVMGEGNWGLVRSSLARIDAARNRGLDVTLDQYPYTGSSTTFTVFLPAWALEGGIARLLDRLRQTELRQQISQTTAGVNWSKVMIASVTDPEHRDLEGLTIEDLGAARGKPPIEAALDLMLAEGGAFSIVRFGMSEEDVRFVMQCPHVMVASDGLAMSPNRGGKPHPRSYGTFTRVLGRYVDQVPALGLEEAIRKMTSFPAQRLGLSDRGAIRPGLRADITLFQNDVADTATFTDPHAYSNGIDQVLVNGQPVWVNGADTGALAGTVVRNITGAR